jgi:hypothetical protein
VERCDPFDVANIKRPDLRGAGHRRRRREPDTAVGNVIGTATSFCVATSTTPTVATSPVRFVGGPPEVPTSGASLQTVDGARRRRGVGCGGDGGDLDQSWREDATFGHRSDHVDCGHDKHRTAGPSLRRGDHLS